MEQFQFDLFEHVVGAFSQPVSGRLSTQELYRIAAGRAGIDKTDMHARSPVGKDGKMISLGKRALRWRMQDAKLKGFITRVPDQKGVWEITDKGRKQLRTIKSGLKVLAFSTELGFAILANSEDVIGDIDVPVHCLLTSPEYPLAVPRAYGNVTPEEYVDKMCRFFEPVMKMLVPGGTIALSLSNDIFERNSPARSTYLERLVIAFEDRLGLKVMDRIVWDVPNKPPGPVRWSSITRQSLNAAYEPIYVFCAQPTLCIANNRRVLEEHTSQHKKLIAQGGEHRRSTNSDGAYRIREGSYGNPTEGKIMRNVIRISNTCASQRKYKKRAAELGLKPHVAPYPLELARRIIRFLTNEDQVVFDPFAGSMTTPLACELEGRQWIACDKGYDYVRGGAERFSSLTGFELDLN